MAVYGCRDFLVRRQKRGRHQHHAEQDQDVTTQKTAGLSSNGHSVCFLFAKITQQQQQNQQLHCCQ